MDTVQRPKGRLFYTVGLPRSGKSTYADRWAYETRRPDGPNRTRVVVSADDFRRALIDNAAPGSFIPALEPLIHVLVKAAVRALLTRGYDVMVDETNLPASQRAAWKEIDPAACEIAFNTPAEVCKERAKATGQDYLIPVIDRMDKEWKR